MKSFHRQGAKDAKTAKEKKKTVFWPSFATFAPFASLR